MTKKRKEIQASAPLFLYISPARLIAMSLISNGLYDLYWIYKNWRYVKERDGLNIRPLWRGLFGLFYCHSLLRRIYDDQEMRAIRTPSFSPWVAATGWVLLLVAGNVVSRGPGPVSGLIAALVPGFLFLLPVQSYVNVVTEKRCPGQGFHPWSAGHWVCLAAGIAFWALLLQQIHTQL